VTRPALPVVLGRRAVKQIERAARWWALNRPAARGAVAEDLEKAFALIAGQPDCGTLVRDSRVVGVRRIHLARLDYFLYYRVAGRTPRIEVLAFWHARRGTGPSIR
jgi:plasmid stabilization system protein ParE